MIGRLSGRLLRCRPRQDFREYVSVIPTSAITGEGVPDILMMLVQLSQKMPDIVEKIMWCPSVQCTVLEVKVIEGLGATADVILANGTLKRGKYISPEDMDLVTITDSPAKAMKIINDFHAKTGDQTTPPSAFA